VPLGKASLFYFLFRACRCCVFLFSVVSPSFFLTIPSPWAVGRRRAEFVRLSLFAVFPYFDILFLSVFSLDTSWPSVSRSPSRVLVFERCGPALPVFFLDSLLRPTVFGLSPGRVCRCCVHVAFRRESTKDLLPYCRYGGVVHSPFPEPVPSALSRSFWRPWS